MNSPLNNGCVPFSIKILAMALRDYPLFVFCATGVATSTFNIVLKITKYL